MYLCFTQNSEIQKVVFLFSWLLIVFVLFTDFSSLFWGKGLRTPSLHFVRLFVCLICHPIIIMFSFQTFTAGDKTVDVEHWGWFFGPQAALENKRKHWVQERPHKMSGIRRIPSSDQGAAKLSISLFQNVSGPIWTLGPHNLMPDAASLYSLHRSPTEHCAVRRDLFAFQIAFWKYSGSERSNNSQKRLW